MIDDHQQTCFDWSANNTVRSILQLEMMICSISIPVMDVCGSLFFLATLSSLFLLLNSFRSFCIFLKQTICDCDEIICTRMYYFHSNQIIRLLSICFVRDQNDEDYDDGGDQNDGFAIWKPHSRFTKQESWGTQLVWN